jgi:hypothetical protein
MATATKFQSFVGELGVGTHNLNTGTLKVMLTNTAPLATNDVKADLTEITAQNGYSAGGETVGTTAYSESGGTGSLTSASTTVFTASGGSFGPFRYVTLYNDTPTSPADPLIQFYDYGSSISLNDGETFTVNWGATVLTIA